MRALSVGLLLGTVVAVIGSAASVPVAAEIDDEADIYVVVDASSPLENLSMGELRRLFLGKTTVLSDGSRVALLEFVSLRRGFYRVVADKSEAWIKKHWIRLVFGGDSAAPPRECRDPRDVFAALVGRPGAIGFVPAGEIPNDARVLRVEGILPGGGGYPLRVSAGGTEKKP